MSSKIDLDIKSCSSPDIDVQRWIPTDPQEVCFLLELDIGLLGNHRSDVFSLVVATPKGLTAKQKRPVLVERATVVVSEYSWPFVIRAIEDIVRRCEGRNWNESVLKLQRYFRWEYEDYSMD